MTIIGLPIAIWGGHKLLQNEVTMMVVATDGAGSAVPQTDEQRRDWRRSNGRR